MSTWALNGGFFSAFDMADTTTVSLAAIKTQTDKVGTTSGDSSNVTGIKAKTDSLTFTVAGKVDSNIKVVADTTVTGSGTAGSPWGP